VGVRNWTACRTAVAEVSDSVCGRTAPVPTQAAGVAMRAGRTPTCSPHLAAAVTCGSSGLGHRVRQRVRRVAVSAGLPQGPPRVHTGGRRAGGGRTPVRAAARRGHQHGYRHSPGHVCRTPASGRLPSGRQSFRKQRTVNPPLAHCRSLRFVTTSSTLPQGRPCGRPPARQRHDRHRGRRPRTILRQSARACGPI
jgi:hypothetical protein